MTTAPATFAVGETYTTRFATDADSRLAFRVVSRSARFITIVNALREDDEPRRVGVKSDDPEGEYALPLGSFSMAPVIRAVRKETA